MTAIHKRVLLVWGAFDLFYLAWYCLASIRAGRIPYVTDLANTLHAVADWGGTPYLQVLSWALQASMLISTLLLLCGWRSARYLALAQVPLRLLFLYPSISLILPVASYLPALLLIILVLLSEAAKVGSLYWYFRR